MKTIQAGVLEIGYVEVGPPEGSVAVLLHGFPYDIHSYDQVSQMLSSQGIRCLTPYLRGYGTTRFLRPQTMRSGEQAALGADLLAFLDALDIERCVLGGFDWGGRAASVVAALWPDRVRGLVLGGPGYSIQNIQHERAPISPEEEHLLWYQYYLHGSRGREGLKLNRDEFCRLLWRMWSPSWDVVNSEFAATAESFQNPDFVDVVIHSYRHRFGLERGDPAYAGIEARLSQQPRISVPSMVLEGGDDGVDPPTDEDLAAQHFSGLYERQILPGIGHNVPQEAPETFAGAILSLG